MNLKAASTRPSAITCNFPRLALGCGLALLAGAAFATEEADFFPGELTSETKAAPDKKPPAERESFDAFISRQLSVFDRPRESLAGQLQSFAEMIDTYFVEGLLEDETNRSRVKLSFSNIFLEHDETLFDAAYSIRVHLPRIEDKLSFELKSDGDPEPDLEPDIPVDAQPTPAEAVTGNDEVQAGVRYVHRAKPWMHVSTRAGAKFGGGEVDPYIELRGRRSAFFDQWGLRFTETLFHRHSIGEGSNSRLDFERPFGESSLFQISSQALFWNEGDYWDLSQQFSLYRKISKSRAISYHLGGVGTHEQHSTRIGHYYLDVRYRKMIHGEWIFGEVVPRIVYSAERDFTPEHMLILRLEMVLD